MFNNNSVVYMFFMFSLVLVVTYYAKNITKGIDNQQSQDDYELVKKYLLNDSALYGKNRTKIWIHSKYEINSRKWKNFNSRNSTDMNQPYLYLTIQSIINHCGDDFHICLIDDDSFEKLIPYWNTSLREIPEPIKTRYRNIAMLQILYIYGGILVPNSFLCLKSLKNIYKQGTHENKPFIAEKKYYEKIKPFMPDISFMGAKKDCPKVKEMINLLNEKIEYFQQEQEFSGKIEKWCYDEIQKKEINIVDGKIIGIKSKIGKPVLLEDLMSENYLQFDNSILHGIYIPSNELLRRPKFSYYAILPVEQILDIDNIVLSKYFKTSMVDCVNSNYKKELNDLSIISI